MQALGLAMEEEQRRSSELSAMQQQNEFVRRMAAVAPNTSVSLKTRHHSSRTLIHFPNFLVQFDRRATPVVYDTDTDGLRPITPSNRTDVELIFSLIQHVFSSLLLSVYFSL